MMDNEAAEIQPTLTSTVDTVLLSPNNDKNDANDSTPTSSTDAASTYSTSVNVTDDPISSTSSDIMEKNKVTEENLNIDNPDMDISKSLLGPEGDVDLLDISMENTSSEPINEDVEDIVQDLENLLGESEPINDFSSRRKKIAEESTDPVVSDTLDFSSSERGDEALNVISTPCLDVKEVIDETKHILTEIIESVGNSALPDVKSAAKISENVTEETSILPQQLYEDSCVEKESEIHVPECGPDVPEEFNLKCEDSLIENSGKLTNDVDVKEENSSSHIENTIKKNETIDERQVTNSEAPILEQVEKCSSKEKLDTTFVDTEGSKQALESVCNDDIKQSEGEIVSNSIHEEPISIPDYCAPNTPLDPEKEQNESSNAEISSDTDNSQQNNDASGAPCSSTLINNDEVAVSKNSNINMDSVGINSMILEDVPQREGIEDIVGKVIEEIVIPIVLEESKESIESAQDVIIQEHIVNEPEITTSDISIPVEVEKDVLLKSPADIKNIAEGPSTVLKELLEDFVPLNEIQNEDQKEIISCENEIQKLEIGECPFESPLQEQSKDQSDEKAILEQIEKQEGPKLDAELIFTSSSKVSQELVEDTLIELEQNDNPTQEINKQKESCTEESSNEPEIEHNEIEEESNNKVNSGSDDRNSEATDDTNKEKHVIEEDAENTEVLPVSLPSFDTTNLENVSEVKIHREESLEQILEQKTDCEELQGSLDKDSDAVVKIIENNFLDEKIHEGEQDISITSQNEIEEICEKKSTNSTTIEKKEILSGFEDSDNIELLPVVEEPIIKKTIIYDHPCSHQELIAERKENIDAILKEEIEQENSCQDFEIPIDTKANISEIVEDVPLGETHIPDEASVLLENSSDKSVCNVDSSDNGIKAIVDEQIFEIDQTNKCSSNESDFVRSQEVSAIEVEPIEKTEKQEVKTLESEENQTISDEHISDLKSSVQKEVEQKNEFECTSSFVDDTTPQEVIAQVKDGENISGNSIENIIHDQTTAAVQSILDNMLAEENTVEITLNKDEAPVVHSSYSSYELQKAVQQIQDISQICDAQEINDVSSYANDTHLLSTPEEVTEKGIKQPEITCIEVENIGKLEEEGDVEATILQESNSNTPETTDQIPESITLEKSHLIVQEAHSEDTEKKKGLKLEFESNDVIETEEGLPVNSTQKQDVSTTLTKPDIPIVQPSIDLSEESSTEDSSEEEKEQNQVTSTVPNVSSSNQDSEDKESKTIKIDSKSDNKVECILMKSDSKKNISKEIRQNRSNEKTKEKCYSDKESIAEPLSISIEETEKERVYSPKITIKVIKEDDSTEEKEEHKGSLKITITKQSDNTHSILKVCSPEPERLKQTDSEDQNTVPKLVIKTTDADQHSPKMPTRSCKQVLSANTNQRSGSPRITIKPIMKPEVKEAIPTPMKITIKPLGKPEEFSKQQQRHSPKLPKSKTEEDHYGTRSKIMKTTENSEVHSPKVTIKPIVKPSEELEHQSTPKITIKPIEKPDCDAKVSPKITIKPVLRPTDSEPEIEDEVKERIVLKINKGTIPCKESDKSNRDARKRELEDDKSEKLAKIKLKFSKGGDAHIVHEATTEKSLISNKRSQDFDLDKVKRLRGDNPVNDSDEDVKLIEDRQSPIVISEDSQSQDSVILIEEAKVASEIVPEVKPAPVVTYTPPVPAAPRKRGRPRKVPLVVREEFGNVPKEEPPPGLFNVTDPPTPETELSGRPKRSCRGQSVRDTLGIKPRKPKGAQKPRGRRGRGATGVSMKQKKEPAFSEGKLALIKSTLTEDALRDARTSCNVSKLETSLTQPKKVILKPLELKGLLEAAKDQNIIEVIEIDSPGNSPTSLHQTHEQNVRSTGTSVGNFKATSVDSKQRKSKEGVDSLKGDGNVTKTEETSVLGIIDAVASDIEMQPPIPLLAPPMSESSTVEISISTDIAMFEEETRMSAETCSRAQTPPKQVVSADVVVEESQSSVQSTATTESVKASRKSRLEVHQELDGSVFTADQLNEYYWAGNGPFMIQEQVAQFLGIKSFKRKYPGIPRRMVDMQERDYIRENGLASESMCDLGLTAVNSADILDIMYSDFQEKYEEYCKHQRDKQAKDLLNKQKAMSMASNHEKSKLDIIDQAVQSAAAYNANFNKVRREQRRACMDLQSMNIHYPKNRMKQLPESRTGNYPVVVVPGQYTDYYREFTPTELNNLPLNTMLYTELHKILPEVSDSDSDSSGSDSEDSSSSESDSDSSCGDRCKICVSNDKKSTPIRKSPVHANA